VANDYRNQGRKTVWYNSRFYRANVSWAHDSINIRDVHLFDEKLKSAYFDKPGTSTQCIYETLPFVDGNKWSKQGSIAGLRLVQLLPNGTTQEITSQRFTVKEAEGNQLIITWQLPSGQKFSLHFYEDRFEVACQLEGKSFRWALELTAAAGIQLPFTGITPTLIDATQDGFAYHITCKKGHFEKATASAPYILRVMPDGGKIALGGRTSEGLPK
jgi:hypothetical protein